MIEALAALVRYGMPVMAAARALEIPERTMSNWLRWGRRGHDTANEPLYVDLTDALDVAQRQRQANVSEAIGMARAHAARPSVRRA